MEELKKRVSICMSNLFEQDFHLIREDLHERTISSTLAYYLKHVFPSYNVDCEYNGNIDNQYRRKAVNMYLQGRQIKFDENVHSVYPDIIIHKRGRNDKNRLLIEIKKSTNRYSNFDKEKLVFFTHPERNTEYLYDYGCFVKIFTGNANMKRYSITWYHEGQIIRQKEIFNL
jgi:hypothetical protein